MSEQSIPVPTDHEFMIAEMAYGFMIVANREQEQFKRAFIEVYAQQLSEIRWLRSLLDKREIV